MNSKTALVFGATGLVGSELCQHLLNNDHYTTIKVFVRKPVDFTPSNKLQIIFTDFEHLEKVQSQIVGDDLFCCLGTTIKKAGTQKEFRKVDFELVFKIAQLAQINQVRHFLVISSLGANLHSSNFYLRTKGEMEQALSSIGFPKLSIIRPSILLGNRKEFRFGEILGKVFIHAIGKVMVGKLKKYKGIEARDVAKALIVLAAKDLNHTIVESDELLELAKEY